MSPKEFTYIFLFGFLAVFAAFAVMLTGFALERIKIWEWTQKRKAVKTRRGD